MQRRTTMMVLLIWIVALLLSVCSQDSTQAVELPPAGSAFRIQTSSPTRGLGVGDWYTYPTRGGGGGGYHYITLHVPCGWPSGIPIYVDLYHPDLNFSPSGFDEIFSADSTVFEIYRPGTSLNPATNPTAPVPNGSGSLQQTTYNPDSVGANWARFYTIDVGTTGCGSYILRAQTNGHADNSWRLRFGTDNDTNPNNAPPANYDNPDGNPGTGDELSIGMAYTTYQQDVSSPQCLTIYEYVAPGQPSVTFHNFDMDGNERVTYYAPSDAFDASGLTGGSVGTVSGGTRWNNSTNATRVGDVINSPEPGWWRIVSCINTDNQFIQEGQSDVPEYLEPPPAPGLTLSKTDGVGFAAPGEVLNYTLTFTNTGNGITAPGPAYNVVLTDTLPADVSFQNCVAPNGTCTHSGGTVIYTRSGPLNYNGSDTITITVQINPSLTSSVTLTNTAVLDYRDGFGNQYPQLQATDTTVINQPLLQLSKTDGVTVAAPGQTLTYTLTFTNTGVGAAHNITLSDSLPGGVTYQSCSVGSLVGTCNESGGVVTFTLTDTLAAGASAGVSVTVQVDTTVTGPTTLTNTATLDYTDSAGNARPSVSASDTTQVPAQPDIVLSKTDGVTVAAPGQTLTYTLTFTNTGVGAAHNITLSDSLPGGVTYQSCSVGSLVGTCNESGGVVTFTLTDTLAAGASAGVSVTVQVDTTVTGPTTLTNTATLDYTDSAGNARPSVSASDSTFVPGPTTVDLTKLASLVVDSNSDNLAGPGDIIEYTLVLTNTGSEIALRLNVSDTPDSHTTLIGGSVGATPSTSVIVRGNAPGDTAVEVTLDELAVNAVLTITFRVRVNDPLPYSVTEISNQATATGANISSTPSDDPTTINPDDPTRLPTPPPGGPPTAIVLTEFRLVASGNGWDIIWTTGAEINTRGFLIYRSTGGRDKAQLLTPIPIPARGSTTSGAGYRFSDTTALAGVDYSYWLVEIELDGTANEYGPLQSRGTISQQHRYFIPLIGR
ncbi:hypothetical protein [Chloroflexus sp.]|uniref:hypothetical protein n=1 Tax=Chloroflexus sp. TaxID=1904827 RepID=UPI00404AA4F2